MALEYNGQRVGAMQYNGVTIGEAMMDGHIVYRSSIYPLEGTWGPTNVPNTATTFDSHTIEEVGEYTITHTATSSGNPPVFVSSIRTPHGSVFAPNGSPSTATLTEQFQPGDLIEFRAASIGASTATGTWSIVKN